MAWPTLIYNMSTEMAMKKGQKNEENDLQGKRKREREKEGKRKEERVKERGRKRKREREKKRGEKKPRHNSFRIGRTLLFPLVYRLHRFELFRSFATKMQTDYLHLN